MSSFSVKKTQKLIIPGTPTPGQNFWNYNGNNIFNINDGNVGINKSRDINYKLDVCGNINISNGQYFDISGAPINNNFYPALTSNNAQKDLSDIAWTIRPIVPDEPTINGLAWSPELKLYVACSQVGLTWRIITSPDGINWTPRFSYGITLSNVSQINIASCRNFDASSNRIDCSDTVNLFVGTYVGINTAGSGLNPASAQITQIIDASSFVTNTRINLTSPPQTLTTSTFICDDTSGLVVGMNVANTNRVGTVGSTSSRSLTNVFSSRVFQLSTNRGWANTECYADRSYFGVKWCRDLSGVGMFVVGAASAYEGTQILTSTDGINWIRRSTPSGFTDLAYMAYAPDLKRVVVCSGSGGTNVGFIYSDDGINWTGVSNTITTLQRPFNIAYSPELKLFAAVGFNNTTSQGVITSPDGINWRSINTPNYASGYNVIEWSPQLGMFCICFQNGSTRSVTVSYDGVNWINLQTNLSPLGRFYSMVWSPELRVFFTTVAQSITGSTRIPIIYWSYDGINWSTKAIGPSSNSLSPRTCLWSSENGVFMVAGNGSGGISRLDAFATSTFRARPPTSYNLFDGSFNFILNNGSNLWTFQTFGRGVPVIKTSTPFTVQPGENWIICNIASAVTVTLPTASDYPGLELMIKSIPAQVVSSTTNVIPLIGGAATSTILPGGTTGRWATLVSNGSQWVIMRSA